jgi:L-cysteine S-thiosulfotransferase
MRLFGIMPILTVFMATPAPAEPMRSYTVEGDSIPLSLTGRAGEAGRGENLVANRQTSLCLLCHQGPLPEPHAQGTLAPDLRGAGKRLSGGQIRLRIVDMARLNPSTIMPSYYRISDHERVAAAWRGKPVLSADEIEDIVAFLVTLKD